MTTKAGRGFVSLLFFTGLIGALVNGAPIYSRFLYGSLLLVLFAWGWTRWVAQKLACERSARILRANVGDVFEESFKITNGGRLPASWIEVGNHSPLPFAAGSRLFTLVMAKQSRSYTARTWLTRRGSFQLGPTLLNTGDPFGLFSASREFTAGEALVVFPMIHDIQSFPAPRGVLTGGQVIRRKSPDITPHAAGVREYTHGDSIRRIHWPTSARRGRLMVKEFEQDPQSEVWLFLDAQKNVHYEKGHEMQEMPVHNLLLAKRPKSELPPSTLEYSVSAAASLAHFFIRQRRAVGFASSGQAHTVLAAERGGRQEAKILETLAFIEADGSLSLAGLVTAQAAFLPQGSSVILITPTTNMDLLQAVDELQLRHLAPIVVLLDANSFGGPGGAAGLASALGERRVPTVSISCGEELSQSLSGFPAHSIRQEFRSWQMPVSSLSI